MTKAERQKVVSDWVRSFAVKTLNYEAAGLKTEEACERAWSECGKVPKECQKEWDECG
jgi:hypothetical protein